MSSMRMAFRLAIAVSLILCAAAVWAAGPDSGINVTVINTPDNPVPVTGSTTVSGTVNASQSGTWTVNANDPTKAPANIVELGCTARQLQTFTCVTITPDASNAGPFVVPQGMKFVITTITIVTGPPFTGITEIILLQNRVSDNSTRVRDRWIVSNATPTTQLQFRSGIVVNSGFQLLEEVFAGNTTDLTIRGYLTGA